jgi:hypothetical protein
VILVEKLVCLAKMPSAIQDDPLKGLVRKVAIPAPEAVDQIPSAIRLGRLASVLDLQLEVQRHKLATQVRRLMQNTTDPMFLDAGFFLE